MADTIDVEIDEILNGVLNAHVETQHINPQFVPLPYWEAKAKLQALLLREREKVAINALAIAEYWIEEDGRPKHLIQDLWNVMDISVLDHIDEKYVKRAEAELSRLSGESKDEEVQA